MFLLYSLPSQHRCKRCEENVSLRSAWIAKSRPYPPELAIRREHLHSKGTQVLDVLLVGAEELENLGTRYLAAVLGQHGYSVESAPFSTADDMDIVVRQAQRTRPRLVGLSIIFQYCAPEFLALATELRRLLL